MLSKRYTSQGFQQIINNSKRTHLTHYLCCQSVQLKSLIFAYHLYFITKQLKYSIIYYLLCFIQYFLLVDLHMSQHQLVKKLNTYILEFFILTIKKSVLINIRRIHSNLKNKIFNPQFFLTAFLDNKIQIQHHLSNCKIITDFQQTFKSMEQISQQQMKQRRRKLIKQLLQLEDAKEMEGDTQKQSIETSHKHKQNVTLELQIKQLDCQQIQNYSNIKLYENIPCRYSPYKKAQFLCFSKYCDNHAIMCGQQTCKCALDHHKCTFTLIESFRDKIEKKIQQPILKQIGLYFQVKSVIYEHMSNRISEERQALMDWQQDMRNDSALFLYVSNLDQAITCHTPKVVYRQKINCNHQKCCVTLQINKNEIKEDKKQIVKTVCKSIHKRYSSMIEYLDQKLDQLLSHRQYANLNSAQYLFIDFLKNMNTYIGKSEHNDFDLDEGLKEIKIVPGRVIYLARRYNKKQFKNLDLEKLSINKLKRIWKGYSEKVFRSFVEGKAINELFSQVKKLEFLKIYSIQNLRSQIDKIMQSISQGQEHLFSKSVFTKKLELKNLSKEQLSSKLKQYKENQVNKIYISDNSDSLVRYTDANFDQVCISNDRLHTALNDIEIVKELSNLRNVTKLEIKWCRQMKAQVSMEILSTMPHLKQLALVHHLQKFSNSFMKKICQFKQLTLFYINSNSRPEYYKSFSQDQRFIGPYLFFKDNLPSIKKLVELSKLPKLQNIEISLAKDVNSAQVIKRMKSLRHLTLGYVWYTNNEIDAGLTKQLREQRALITLSLIGLKVESKQVDHIITKNLHLKTIIIRNYYENENINDETVECMSNLIQLQNLCIQSNTAITGKHLSKLDKLMMLEIYDCPNVSKKEMKEALTKMHKLQYLDINCNQWFDDKVVRSVQSCKKLTYLNILNTSVSCEGLKHLEGLTRLNILICDDAKINGNNLIELTKQIPRIARLSINNLDVNDNQILQISANCQALTHLDIRFTKIKVETLLKIKQLKVINCSLDGDSKKQLREAGIQTY